jgi:archaeoflavoprotein AfpA
MEKKPPGKKRVAWAISGSGDRIERILKIMKNSSESYKDVQIRVYISKAAQQVLNWYRLFDEIKESFQKVRVEINSNAPFLAGELQVGYYEFLLIAPSTSNTTAKIALGIGDTMISNATSMAMKVSVPVCILPSDYDVGIVVTKLPDGRDLELNIMDKDVRHVRYLESLENVNILKKPEEILTIFKKHFG